MQLYFIRHGQSANNLLYATTGSDNGRDSDPELTAIGWRQAGLLADFLAREQLHIDFLYSSLMIRSVATGTLVADRLGISIAAWTDLHEEGGIYLSDGQGNRIGQPGKDRMYFKTCYPSLILPESVNPSGWWNRPYESKEDRPLRARRFLQQLIALHGGQDLRVAVISHGGFYNHFLNAILSPTTSQNVWFSLNNTAITRIDFSPNRVDLIYQNRHEFLPDELIT